MSRLFRQAGVIINQHTRFYRHLGANHAYDLGQDVKFIEHHGGWKKDKGRLTTLYINPLPKGVAYAMAGSTQVGAPPFIKRAVLRPPPELQRKVFPFLEDYYDRHPDRLMLLDNIMGNRDEFQNRLTTEWMPTPSDSDLGGVLRLNFLRMLANLCKVDLQDAVTLMDLSPDDYMNYAHHDVFENLIFKDELFLEYRTSLLSAIDSAIPPQSDLLLHNAPAIHTEFRNLDSKATNGFAGTRSDMRAFTQEIKSTMDSNFQLLKKTILAKIGNAMGQQLDSLKDFLSIIQNQYNLAFSLTIQRVYR